MQRRILIVDDHDDLKTALTKVFTDRGFVVEAAESRDEALKLDQASEFDLVIADLDGEKTFHSIEPAPAQNGNPQENNVSTSSDSEEYNRSAIKAFKICAINFQRENFDEDELKDLFETVLNYKSKFVDLMPDMKHIREKIEFEIPSAISLMNSILEYLMRRVEKVGIINPENSNLFIALDEAFVNAVKHGNKFDAAKNVRITAEVSATEARFTVEDEGEGFDVNAIPDPLDPVNLFKTSGRGVLLIHNIMDEVRYNERGNRLEMVKRNEREKANR
jgi:serine/threonine-protein kinase RsbW